MRVGSLFAGIGGFDIAAERAGMEVLWQSEIDPSASRVLEHYWPGRNLGDIHNIRMETGDRTPRTRPATAGNSVSVGRGGRGDERHATDDPDSGGTGADIRLGLDTDRSNARTGSEPDAEGRFNDRDSVTASDHPNAGGTDERIAAAVDVLTGGFPCQDYSVAGNRAGLAGDRGALWWEYHRLIAQGRPLWIVAENVPGLLSSRGGEDFATIIDSLTQLGYGVAWGVLDAQYFGVAQRRRRVFIVGHSGGRPRPEILAFGEGVHGHPQPVRASGGSVAHALTQRTNKGGDPTSDTYIAFAQNQRDEFLVARETGAGYWNTDGLAGLRADPGGLGGNIVIPTDLVAAQGVVTKGNGEAFLTGDKITSLATGGGQLGQGRPSALIGPTVRRLTPLECERLQGFPDGWTNTPGNSDTQRYRQLGNAVAVPVVEWILKRVATVGNSSRGTGEIPHVD